MPTERRFSEEASRPSRGAVAELTDFLLHNKKWWLAPIIITLVLVSLLVLIGGTATPYIYTLF